MNKNEKSQELKEVSQRLGEHLELLRYGTTLESENIILAIRERKKDLQKKTKNFLIYTTDKKKYSYLSSLHKLGDFQYRFDTMDSSYMLELLESKAIVRREH